MITNWIRLGLVAVLLIGFIDGDDEGEFDRLSSLQINVRSNDVQINSRSSVALIVLQSYA